MTPTLNPAIQLADLLKQCQSWAEVEQAIARHPAYKTEAWQLLSAGEKTKIRELKQQATQAQVPEQQSPAPALDQGFKVGDRVLWHDCPACLGDWNPFVVRQVMGDTVALDWVATPVYYARLILVE